MLTRACDDARVFDINAGELGILAVVALVVIGPERLPKYAADLGKLVRDVRGFARNARDQVRDELGEDFDDIDWQSLDPRRYDPRRIVREALLDDLDDIVNDRPTVSDTAPNVPDTMRPAEVPDEAADAAVDLTKKPAPRGFDPDAT